MTARMRLIAVVVGLLVIGSCSDDDASSGARSSASASPTPAPGPTEAEPAPASVAPPPDPGPPPPPPLDVTPIAYVAPREGVPDQLPVPALPEPGPPAASLTVGGSWTGGFHIDGTDPRVSVSCSAQPSNLGLVEVYIHNYIVSTETGTGPYGLPDGGWNVLVTRWVDQHEDEVDTAVSVTAVTSDGEAVELADSSGIGEVVLAADASTDDSAVAFSGVPAAIPRDHGLYELVQWVTFTGTVRCPGPLPRLTLLETEG